MAAVFQLRKYAYKMGIKRAVMFELQCGRSLSTAEIRRPGSGEVPCRRGFNVAAVFQLRKYMVPAVIYAPFVRFNVAAVFQLRKCQSS